jgi:hypothetical protein
VQQQRANPIRFLIEEKIKACTDMPFAEAYTCQRIKPIIEVSVPICGA